MPQAIIDHAGADNTIVAAVAGKRIRVMALAFVCSGVNTVRFESTQGGDALTGQMQFGAHGGYVLPHNPNGWFETDVGELLNMELANATSVDGHLTYLEI